MLYERQDQMAELLRQFSYWVHLNAADKGWHDKPMVLTELIALKVSELGEAVEWDRKGNPKSDHIPAFSGVEEELADDILRTLDFAEENNLNVIGAMLAKHKFNKTR